MLYFWRRCDFDVKVFNVITDNLEEIFYVISPYGKVIWCNRKACETFNFCREDEVILCERCPFGYKSIDNCDLIKRAIKDGFARDYFCLNLRGKVMHYMVTVTPIVWSGSFIGFIVLLTDITEVKKLQEKLEDLLKRDPLTGIYNRRVLDEEVSMLLNLAKRYNRNLSFVMLDLDNFKSVNDFYGHEVGDEVLKELVRVVKKRLRSSDVFLRFGGEEFLIVLPETDNEGAMKLAEDVRKAIENHTGFPCGRLTVSVGVTSYREGDTLDSIIIRVDEAMYNSKRRGKNRVTVL
ncbi:MAG: diguanylate cyclase [Thermosulfidibacteraceae bacterium]